MYLQTGCQYLFSLLSCVSCLHFPDHRSVWGGVCNREICIYRRGFNFHLAFCLVLAHYNLLITDLGGGGFCNRELCIYRLCVNIHLVLCLVSAHYNLLISNRGVRGGGSFYNREICIYTMGVNIHLVFCLVLAPYTLLITDQGGFSVIVNYTSTDRMSISIYCSVLF